MSGDEGNHPAGGVRELSPCWVPLPDGLRLAGRLWLPVSASTARPVPAVVECIPYRTRDLTAIRDEGIHGTFAAAGYASLRLDLRGTGDSDGLIGDEYTAQELADCCEVIAWLAAQPWCTGRVGMLGNSWGGFNALQVAALRPPALAAIITSCSTDDRFADDMHYRGGALLTDMLDWGATFLCWMSLPPDPSVAGPTWRDTWQARIGAAASRPAVATWLEHQRLDDYWRHGSVSEDYAAITCPVLALGGWQDGYSNAIPRLMAGLSVPTVGVIGPWAHGYPHTASPGPGIDFLGLAIRWWDHWLRDRDTGLLDEPRYRVFLQDGLPPDAGYAAAPGRWIAEAGWPADTIRPSSWRLTAAGDLVAAQPRPAAGATASRADPVAVLSGQTVGLAGGEWCPYGTGGGGPELPGDQAEDDARSVSFESPPLSDRLEILGAPRVVLRLAAAYRGLAVVRLCDVWPDGRSSRVSFAVLRVDTGDAIELVLDDTAYAFLPGHRIRLALSTSYWPMVWPEPEARTLFLDLAACTLVLPVRPVAASDAALPSLGAPWRPPIAADRLTDRADSRATTLMHDGSTVVSNEVDSGLVRVRSSGVTIRATAHDTATIHDDDPLSARMDAERGVELRFPTGDEIAVTARLSLRATPDDYLLTGRLMASDGAATVADRSFSRVIPRSPA